MFGNDTTDNQTSNTGTQTTMTQDASQAQAPVFGVDPITSAPTTSVPSLSSDDTASPAMVAATPAPEVTPATEDMLMPAAPVITDAPSAPMVTTTGDIASTPGDLMELKKDALAKLGPLVDKLDQSPEEKFKTTMMMIQASDDKTLIPKAYDAANMIADEKSKAQALLDIINEINYFTSASIDKD